MNFPANLNQTLAGTSLLAFPLALLGGLIAGMNPCCLALYPAVAGSCCGQELPTVRRSFGNAFAFVLGVAVAIAVLGSAAAYVGKVTQVATPVKYVIALIPILMGVYRLGWLELPALSTRPLQPGFGGAFGSGLLLSLILGPCGTPVLASVLSYAAYKQSFVFGGLLLFAYGLGNGLPLVLVGTASGSILKRLDSSRFARFSDPLVGSSLLLLGFYLLWRI